jgi:acetyl-CoA carboxylase biotin carboxyl carrier protein
MNLKEIKEMIQLMNENGLSEFEMEKDGLKIRLRKGAGGVIESAVVAEPLARTQSGPSRTSEASSREALSSAKRQTIQSPMVGTFYSSPAPDAASFVQVGAQIEPGQVICVIEAMKLMNEIKSEVRGKITEILVHNGDPVEFGQPIFVIE